MAKPNGKRPLTAMNLQRRGGPSGHRAGTTLQVLLRIAKPKPWTPNGLRGHEGVKENKCLKVCPKFERERSLSASMFLASASPPFMASIRVADWTTCITPHRRFAAQQGAPGCIGLQILVVSTKLTEPFKNMPQSPRDLAKDWQLSESEQSQTER